MKDFELADRLNKLNNQSVNCACGLVHNLPVTFLGGNYINALKDTLAERTPYGRVALVCGEADYLKFATPIKKAVESVGCSMVGLAVNSSCDSVDDISGLFNLPEDTRAVIVLGEALFSAVCYYAKVKGVLVIAVCLSLNIAYTFGTCAYLKNGENVDRVNLPCERYVVLDGEIVDKNGVPDVYAFIMSKLTALTDYRLYASVNNISPCKFAYGLAKTAVISSLGIIKVKPCDMALTLMEYSAYLGMANGITKGALYDFSSAVVTSKLYGRNLPQIELYASVKLMGVYDLLLNGGHAQINASPDYLARAEFFANNYPYPLSEVEKSLIVQIRAIRHGEKKLNSVIKSVKPEIGTNAKFVENVMKIYYALGGERLEIDEQKFRQALKHGGDAPYYLNGLSIARDAGLLEYL